MVTGLKGIYWGYIGGYIGIAKKMEATIYRV